MECVFLLKQVGLFGAVVAMDVMTRLFMSPSLVTSSEPAAAIGRGVRRRSTNGGRCSKLNAQRNSIARRNARTAGAIESAANASLFGPFGKNQHRSAHRMNITRQLPCVDRVPPTPTINEANAIAHRMPRPPHPIAPLSVELTNELDDSRCGHGVVGGSTHFRYAPFYDVRIANHQTVPASYPLRHLLAWIAKISQLFRTRLGLAANPK